MANVALTNVCNLDCNYCFALSDIGHASGHREDIPSSRFEATLDFLDRSGIREARLLGGEPTLHPLFPEFVATALGRGFHVVVFSNAIMPEPALACLEQSPEEAVSILVNARRGDDHKPAQLTRIHDAYRRLSSKVMLGFNIESRTPELDFLLSDIERFGLRRTVRLGLAHPRLEGENEHLRPRDYPAIGKRILAFAANARSAAVKIEFDCGFVPCMFPPESVDELETPDLGLRCNPILDLMPNGEFISCYPLSTLHREKLTQIVDATELRQRFTAEFASLREATLYPECVNCGYRLQGKCSGGCLSSSLRRRRQTRFSVRESRREANEKSEIHLPVAIPYIDQPRSFWEHLSELFGSSIREVYFPPPREILGTGRPEQPSAHTEEFLRDVRLPKSLLLNSITLPEPVECVAPRVIEAIRRYRGEFGVESATVADLSLAERIREAFPDFHLVGSVLLDVFQPNQTLMFRGVFDTLVPSSRIVRDIGALKQLRSAFPGKLRLLVNEACLSGCLYRTQHFHEMANSGDYPRSLCDDLVIREPWMRLTGSWILPQHLPHYEGACDEIKLAGRATLDDPAKYRRVLGAYIRRTPLKPHEIGGGPASPLEPIAISEEFAYRTSRCGQNCHSCSFCRDYYEAAIRPASQNSQLVQIQVSVPARGVNA